MRRSSIKINRKRSPWLYTYIHTYIYTYAYADSTSEQKRSSRGTRWRVLQQAIGPKHACDCLVECSWPCKFALLPIRILFCIFFKNKIFSFFITLHSLPCDRFFLPHAPLFTCFYGFMRICNCLLLSLLLLILYLPVLL